ncbi:MAG TPA: amylo-alpha-1,6-glucosidase [Thermoanaerobaculia bacterium]|nr:amylo-alpha-1,6-glucosidase [Thermoanaerobaculia bacterium]
MTTDRNLPAPASAEGGGGRAPAADPEGPQLEERPDPAAAGLPWPDTQLELRPAAQPESLLRREWLVTNGLGGYASGTLAGIPTRRYHGLLVAALTAPVGRTLMLGQLSEVLRLPNGLIVQLGGEHLGGMRRERPGTGHLRELRLEAGLPVWRYEVGGYVVEKRVFLAHLQNTAYVLYRLCAGPEAVRLEVHPTVHFRPHDAPVSTPLGTPYVLTATGDRYELASSWPALPPLRLWLAAAEATFTVAGRQLTGVRYEMEEKRGYESLGDLWCPGFFGADLAAGEEAGLIASTDPWETLLALHPREALAAENERRERLVAQADPRARAGTPAELVLAADQFVISPGRSEDKARARAAGDEARSVIAGYHWFTDWGRDTMISLEGLTLATGRHVEAGYILRTFARHVRDGLIPNLFPEGDRDGQYNTADATLWFFHALDRYLAATADQTTLDLLLPVLVDIVEHHVAGTRFGIGVDPADGLLRQGAEDTQLTWMDAKVDGWVVTPRRGKAVEINALWYNALCLLEGWLRRTAGGPGDEAAAAAGGAGDMARADRIAALASRVRDSFNRRFWNAHAGCLYDVVDGEGGDDPACRPNQIFALSLPHPVLARERWQAVFDTVRRRLLTPVGLRSLAPGEPDYQPRYDGDLRARDAAYHQGTVWAWLIGPYFDAWLRLHPGDRAEAHALLAGFVPHLGEGCLGTIGEIFDAEQPWTPRGCVAQAWSVAEVLRAWIATTPVPPGVAP